MTRKKLNNKLNISGNELRKIREERHMSREKLSNMLLLETGIDLSAETIANIENNKRTHRRDRGGNEKAKIFILNIFAQNQSFVQSEGGENPIYISNILNKTLSSCIYNSLLPVSI